MSKQAESLMGSYRSYVQFGKMEPLEALQKAVDATIPRSPEYARAELYTRLAERWLDYRDGVIRKMFVKSTLAGWKAWYVRAPRPEVPSGTDNS